MYMNEDNFVFDFREEAPQEVEANDGQQDAAVEQPNESAEQQDNIIDNPESGAEDANQPSVDELLAKIAELEAAQSQLSSRMPEEALAILQDKNTLRELAKDYDTMPMLDLLKEEFYEKNQKVLDSNPNLDKETAFKRFLQKSFHPDIEPEIEENLGLDEYDYALLKSQVDELREARIQKQASLQSALGKAPFNSETDSSAMAQQGQQEQALGEDDFQSAMREYEQRLTAYVETGLKNIKPSAPAFPEGINAPAIGEDVLRNMINTLSAEQLPLIVADDNNVYPNLSLLKEIAEYRELQKNLPQMLASYKEKIVAETYQNIKNGIANKADTPQAPSNPFTGDIISPPNMGENIITGFKF